MPGLEAALVPGAAVALVPGQEAAGCGRDWPGACGKTQLASHLAGSLQRSRTVDLPAWVTATSRASVLSGYVRAAAEIGLDHGGDAESVAARFAAWLDGTAGPWLVVLDDLCSAADLDGLWPAGAAGRLLIATRPTPSPSTPGKGGACCATASSSSTTRANSCPWPGGSSTSADPRPTARRRLSARRLTEMPRARKSCPEAQRTLPSLRDESGQRVSHGRTSLRPGFGYNWPATAPACGLTPTPRSAAGTPWRWPGKLTTIVRAGASAVARLMPVFETFSETFSKTVIHAGPTGSDQYGKLFNNALMMNHKNVIDALRLARSLDLPIRPLLDVLRSGSAARFALQPSDHRSLAKTSTTCSRWNCLTRGCSAAPSRNSASWRHQSFSGPSPERERLRSTHRLDRSLLIRRPRVPAPRPGTSRQETHWNG